MADFWVYTYIGEHPESKFRTGVTDKHPAEAVRRINEGMEKLLKENPGKLKPNYSALIFAMRITEEEFKAWEGDDDVD